MLSNNEVLYLETHERINGAKVQHILDAIK
jgi:hypothetical protein